MPRIPVDEKRVAVVNYGWPKRTVTKCLATDANGKRPFRTWASIEQNFVNGQLVLTIVIPKKAEIRLGEFERVSHPGATSAPEETIERRVIGITLPAIDNLGMEL